MATLTANEDARISAQRFRRELRVSIGPPRNHVQRALFTANEPVTVASSTTTTAGIDDTSTSIPVNSTSGFDTGLGTLLLQSGDNLLLESGDKLILESETYDAGRERIIQVESSNGVGWASYQNTSSTSFNGIEWQHGVTDHASGATVTQWYDITDRVDHDSIMWEETEDLPFYDFTAEMSGYQYDSSIMWDDATVLVEERLDPDGSYGTFTGWQVAFVGYVRNWNPTTEYRDNHDWRADITSISRYVFNTRVNSRSYGPVNIAEGKTVTDGDSESGTTPNNLGDPSLEPAEFAGGFGDTTSDLLVDENTDTVYISATAPTETAETPGDYTGTVFSNRDPFGPRLIIDEVFLQGPAGAPADLQYIVVKLPDYGDKRTVNLDSDEHWIAFYDQNASRSEFKLPEDVTLQRTGDNDTEVRRLILCKSRPIFERYFGVAGDGIIREWDTTASLDTTAGAVHVRQDQYPSGFGNSTIEDMVAWGSWDAGFFESGDDTDHWNDTNVVSVPSAGKSMRRKPTETDSDQDSDWTADATPLPTDPRDRSSDDVFISVDLGTFTINPSDAITASYPHADMWWPFSDVGPFSPSGTIQIDSEQITYSQKDPTLGLYITARGANMTTPAAHTTSATVKQLHSQLGAHQLFGVESVELARRRVLDDNNDPIVPEIVEVWGSNEVSPKYPGASNYEEDWIIGRHTSGVAYSGSGNEVPPVVVRNTDNALKLRIDVPENDDTSEPFRLRHVMVRIRRMSDGGRVKLNELRAYRWPITRVQDSGTGAFKVGEVIVDLLREVVDESEIDVTSGGFTAMSRTFADVQIREGNLRTILSDLCNESMLALRFAVDGTIDIERDPRHPLQDRPAILADLDKSDIRSPLPTSKPSRIAARQYVVEIDDPLFDETFVGRYPNGRVGDVKRRHMRMIVGSNFGASLIARALYLDDPDISQEHDMTTAGPFAKAHAGSQITHPVDYDEQGSQTLNGRITSVRHNVNGAEEMSVKEWRVP